MHVSSTLLVGGTDEWFQQITRQKSCLIGTEAVLIMRGTGLLDKEYEIAAREGRNIITFLQLHFYRKVVDMLKIVMINQLFVVMMTFFIVIHGQNGRLEAFFIVLNVQPRVGVHF